MGDKEDLEREIIRLKKELEEALDRITIMEPSYIKEKLRKEDEDKRSTEHYTEFNTKVVSKDVFNTIDTYGYSNPFWGSDYHKTS